MKQALLSFALLASAASVYAGDYLTNTNQHVSFLRNPARNASTEIDAIYSNPAGIAFLPEGWHLSLNIQSAYQTRLINSTFAPFAANANNSADASGKKRFKGEASAPVIPSVYAAYKRDKWTFATSFALSGGGGKATFNSGLPSFEAPVSLIPASLNAASTAMQVSKYSFDTYMQGRQYIFGLNIGAAYKIKENLSVYLGGRINYVSNHYEGYLRNISANIGGTDAMIPLNAYFTAAATQYATAAAQYTAAAAQYTAAGDAANAAIATATAAQYNTAAARATATAQSTADKELDCDQSGWGFTPIIGVDYKVGKFNFGAKYEFRTHLNIQNQTKINTTGFASFSDGVNTPHDIPAQLSLGASYEAVKGVNISAGYHHFFDKNARMGSDRQKTLDRGTNEYLLGVEWDITPRIKVSTGGQITSYGVTDDFQQDLSFYCSSYSLGFGAQFKLSEKIKLNVAYFFTDYKNYEKTFDNYYNTSLPGKDVYKRTNTVIGAGIDISL